MLSSDAACRIASTELGNGRSLEINVWQYLSYSGQKILFRGFWGYFCLWFALVWKYSLVGMV
jgi:hypothetical protein